MNKMLFVDYYGKKIMSFNSRNMIFLVFLLIASFVVFLFGKRVIFPDIAFDTVNYHFFLGRSGVENFPNMFSENEFFPIGMHSFNPLLDSLNYKMYEILGYRFGTLISVIALLASLVLSVGIVFRTCETKISFVASLFLIPALVVNEGLFQVATYFTDNVFAVLVLSYIYVLLRIKTIKSISGINFTFLALGIILGLLATKLTNAVYIIPLFFATLYSYISIIVNFNNSCSLNFKRVRAMLFFVMPPMIIVFPFFYQAFELTGNPVFPYYNSIFQSEFYPQDNWPFNFGPTNIVERLFYPFFALLDPYLLGEVKDMFPDVKLITSLLFTLILLLIIFYKKIKLNDREIILLVVTLSAFFGWQFLFGYSRYGIALEFLLGISVLVLINKLLLDYLDYPIRILIVLYAMLSFWQAASIIGFNSKYDISWRPSVSFGEWRSRFFDIGMFEKFTVVDVEQLSMMREVDVVVQCTNPSSAYSITIPELMDKPLLNFDIGSNGAMTLNDAYVRERDRRIYFDTRTLGKRNISFVVVFNDTNPGMHQRENCFRAFDKQISSGRDLVINNEARVDNFVGDERQVLTLLYGTYLISGVY